MRILLVVFAFAASIAQSQTYDVTRTPVGTEFRFSSSIGDAVITYEGPDDGLFLFRYVRDNGPHPTRLLNWTNQAGQTVRVQEGDLQLRFRPHDCSFVVGTCKFVVTNNRGGRFPMVEVAKYEDGVWHYNRYRRRVSPNTLEERGRVEVDKEGMPLRRDWIDQGGEQHWTRRQ